MDTIFYPITFAVVAIFGLFLITLGGVSLLAPSKAKVFLLGFATNAFTHYLEMSLRLVVGGSIVYQAPYLNYAIAFAVFGWMMFATTAVLLITPWRWHRRFAEKAVPPALRYLPIVGVVSLTLGSGLLIHLLRGRVSAGT